MPIKNIYCNQTVLQIWLLLVVFLVQGCGAHVRYQVRPGDTLYSIGWRYQVDHNKLAHWNEIDPPFTIKPGQWIRMAPPVRRNARNPHHTASISAPEAPSTIKTPSRPSKPIPKKTTPEMPTTDVMASSAKSLNWHWPVSTDQQPGTEKLPNRGQGIAIKGKKGDSVLAAAAGEVVYSGVGLTGYGKLVIIKHNNIYLSAYAHNDRILVKEGEKVKQGQRIATMGNSGIDQVLLYFEIRKYGEPVDPVTLIKRSCQTCGNKG